ncbi:MAG: aldo/keto reductase [Phycisphaerae bacterium]|nr:aldo/keto reductase [Phycisphaerae bacterium]
MTESRKPDMDLTPKPVDGPLDEAAFFAIRSPASGMKPCRRLALGAASLGQLHGTPEQERGIETFHAAWRAGFLLVDTAPGYGPSELLLGEALKRWKGERPIVATKTPQRNPGLEGVVEQYHRSVERLGKIDLLAVHDAAPDVSEESRRAICDYIAGLIDEGQIDAAGLGGAGPDVQRQWLEAGIFRYAITFIRLGAVSLQALEDQVPQTKAHGAAVVAASPLFLGLLGSRQEEFLANPPRHYAPVFIERVKALNALAGEWSISRTHLAIRFLLSMPVVDLVLAGAANPQEWADVQAAYEAGPLPVKLYAQVWDLAQRGAEPMVGG